MVVKKWTLGQNKIAVLKRDNYKCRKCGREAQESFAINNVSDEETPEELQKVLDKMYTELEVHHINRKRFGTKDSWDFVSNLTTLCVECHKGIHDKIRKLEKNETTS